MSYRNLRDYLSLLEGRGELKRIRARVSPRLEITEIADRLVKSGGPAVLFENVEGSQIPVAINLFGTYRRMAWALGVERLDEIAERIEELLALPKRGQGGLWARIGLLPKLAEMARFGPRTTGSAPVQQVVLKGEEVDLSLLPVLTCWPGDGGPFITLPQVITRDPDTGERNSGMYRVQVLDRRTTAIHWQRHKTGMRHFLRAKELGKPLEVAIAIGGDPALIYSASAPLPEGMDEFVFAGFLRKEGVEVVRCKTVDLEVPAEAEIVLEGYVDPREDLRLEGPFGDHTGFYSLADYYPAFHVTALTMRRDAIYPATIVGRPPMEDFWLGHATERIFLPLIRLMLPEIIDYHMPPESVFHNLVFVSINKQYPGHAYKVASGLLGLGLMSLSKVIVVFDSDVNIQDTKEAWWIALSNIDPERDVRFIPGPVDVLDHASPTFTYGTKMVIDATRKWREEGFERDWPEKIQMSPDIIELVDRRWAEYGF